MPDKYLRQEYIARINKVIDHVEKHLETDLSLHKLAQVANFSPYHFHRIFKGITGETLNQFIQRLRVEKAATQLATMPKKSITEIALDNGFSGSAVFARVFKSRFGMSASAWRDHYLDDRKNRQMDRKDDQQESKDRKTFDFSSSYIGNIFDNQKWRIMLNTTLNAEVTVKDLPETHVIYVRHTGPYAGNSELFGRLFNKLFGWAGPRGLLRFPETKTMSVYHDNPDITDDDKLRLSVCLTVPEGTEVDGDIGKMSLPAGKYAVAHFELLPNEYSDAWDVLYGGWLPESGYQPSDSPCFEMYYNDPKTHPEGRHIVDICVPVEPL